MKRKLFLITFFLIYIFLNYNICSAAYTSEVYSPAAILIHPDSGKILYEKNAYSKMYPASTTKIMTAIIVLESGISLR